VRVTYRPMLISLLILLLAALPVSGEQGDRYLARLKAFEKFVEKQMSVDRIPGLSIGFIKDDFIWAKGFGYADLEHMTPAKDNSSYRLASNTKSMVAVAILQLAEEGKVDLDAEVRNYVSYFPWKRWPVTVRQLLGHLGGISHYRNYDLEGHIKEHKDTRDALAIFADFDLVAEPGTKYNYSSYGYNLLGAVVEEAAKQPFGDYMREHLWEPLGMNDTYMDDPDQIIPNRVQGYRLIDGEVENSEYVDISSRFAAGGTLSTVLDLLKYARGLNSEEVLSRESIDMMQTSMTTKDGHFTDYGMGWRVTPVNGRYHVYHTGGQPETRTILVRFPKENFAIALAYNLEGANLHVYSHRLVQLILDEAWNMHPYMDDRANAALYNGLWETFNYGLAYFDRYEEAHSSDSADLAKAFAHFNDCLNLHAVQSDFKKAVKKINSGRHPVAEEAFLKVGSYIAMRLQEKLGPQRVEVYRKVGAIPFFGDYVKFCESNPDQPDGLHLSEELTELVVHWRPDWEKTCDDYTRGLVITPFSDIDKIGGRLKKLFARAEVYPDFTADLARVTRRFCVTGDRANAVKTARLSLDLYPESVVPHAMMAAAHVCFGEKDKAREFYRKALEIDEDDRAISAASLNQQAAELFLHNRLNEAAALLEIAVELYPNEAELYDTMAEIHLTRGKRLYEKALEVDPGFEHARDALKKLE